MHWFVTVVSVGYFAALGRCEHGDRQFSNKSLACDFNDKSTCNWTMAPQNALFFQPKQSSEQIRGTFSLSDYYVYGNQVSIPADSDIYLESPLISRDAMPMQLFFEYKSLPLNVDLLQVVVVDVVDGSESTVFSTDVFEVASYNATKVVEYWTWVPVRLVLCYETDIRLRIKFINLRSTALTMLGVDNIQTEKQNNFQSLTGQSGQINRHAHDPSIQFPAVKETSSNICDDYPNYNNSITCTLYQLTQPTKYCGWTLTNPVKLTADIKSHMTRSRTSGINWYYHVEPELNNGPGDVPPVSSGLITSQRICPLNDVGETESQLTIFSFWYSQKNCARCGVRALFLPDEENRRDLYDTSSGGSILWRLYKFKFSFAPRRCFELQFTIQFKPVRQQRYFKLFRTWYNIEPGFMPDVSPSTPLDPSTTSLFPLDGTTPIPSEATTAFAATPAATAETAWPKTAFTTVASATSTAVSGSATTEPDSWEEDFNVKCLVNSFCNWYGTITKGVNISIRMDVNDVTKRPYINIAAPRQEVLLQPPVSAKVELIVPVFVVVEEYDTMSITFWISNNVECYMNVMTNNREEETFLFEYRQHESWTTGVLDVPSNTGDEVQIDFQCSFSRFGEMERWFRLQPIEYHNYSAAIAEKDLSETVIGVIAASGIICLIIIIAVVGYVRRRRRMQKPGSMSIKRQNRRNRVMNLYSFERRIPTDEAAAQVVISQYTQLLAVSRKTIEMGDTVLGRGESGIVFKGLAHKLPTVSKGPTTVAIKTLVKNADKEQQSYFSDEHKVMLKAGRHVNLVNIMGIVPEEPPLLILEYCRCGSVLSYIRNRRNGAVHSHVDESGRLLKFDESEMRIQWIALCQREGRNVDAENMAEDMLSTDDFIRFSHQICRGMEYLASRSIIHRDLAARNVLVADDRIIKISYFGLAKHGGDSYTVSNVLIALPILWMPPDTIINREFSEKSDVWGFGIVLWEIFSLGQVPFDRPNVSKFSANAFAEWLQEGHQMARPDGAPNEIYKIMQNCWSLSASARPTFSMIWPILDALVTATVDSSSYLPLEDNDVPKDIAPEGSHV